MQLSVIILNYNVRYFLEQCVLSVKKALEDIDGEVIVVDNNSPDDSCAMMKQRFPDVKLIENKENTGFPKGNNIGVAAAKGKYICILNPDTVVAEDTFKKVLAFADTRPNMGITGVKLVDGTGNFLPESKRGVPTPWVAFTKISGQHKVFPRSQKFNRYYAQHVGENETGIVDILVGAFMVMKRELYIEVGGFDEGCFMYSDDIDLSYMVQKKGRTNYYFHDTRVIHYKGESTVKDGTYMKRFREAMQFFYKKHFRNYASFDLFMRGGTLFYAIAKQKKKAPVVVPDNYVLFSDDEELRKSLENKLQKKVKRIAEYNEKVLNSQTFSGLGQVEIIFDNDLIPFVEIISIMEKNSEYGYTYKIKPAGSNFIIGSNSSNDRGEVIVIK